VHVQGLLDKGFRVWPSGCHRRDATKTFLAAAIEHRDNPRMLGYLSTTCYKVRPDALHAFESTKIAAEKHGM